MRSSMRKRSVLVRSHKTSVSLENEFWNALKTIARTRGQHTMDLVEQIDANRVTANLSSAIRCFVLDHFKSSAMHQKTPQEPTQKDDGPAQVA